MLTSPSSCRSSTVSCSRLARRLEDVFQMELCWTRLRRFRRRSVERGFCVHRQIPERYQRNEAAVEALRRVDRSLLGEALGKKYVEKYFPPEAKVRMQEMVSNLLAAMKDDIVGLPWMSDETKQKALVKLATFNPQDRLPGQVEGLQQRRRSAAARFLKTP